jgi:hypothetical protein
MCKVCVLAYFVFDMHCHDPVVSIDLWDSSGFGKREMFVMEEGLKITFDILVI